MSGAAPPVSLAEYLADTPQNAERRAAQEADWDLAGAEDARQLLYEREVAFKYSALVARSVNAYHRVETLVAGHGQGSSVLSALPATVIALVCAWAEGSGADLVAAEASRRREAAEVAASAAGRVGVRVFARIRPAWDAAQKNSSVVERARGAACVPRGAATGCFTVTFSPRRSHKSRRSPCVSRDTHAPDEALSKRDERSRATRKTRSERRR